MKNYKITVSSDGHRYWAVEEFEDTDGLPTIQDVHFPYLAERDRSLPVAVVELFAQLIAPAEVPRSATHADITKTVQSACKTVLAEMKRLAPQPTGKK